MHMKNLVALFILVLMPRQNSFSSPTYEALPIAKKVKDADIILQGIYLGKVEKKNTQNEIETDLIFKPIKMAGMNTNLLLNKNELKVTIPGGFWMGVEHRVSDSPKFIEGSEVLLLLKRTKTGLTLLNNANGAYWVEKKNRQRYFRSYSHPNDPRYGLVSPKKLTYALYESFSEGFTEIEKNNLNHYVYKASTASRSPGSVIQSEDNDPEEKFSFYLLFFVFSVLGSYISLKNRDR